MDVSTHSPGTLIDEVLGADITDLSDHDMVEAMVAARRLASQAQAVELAAVAELARRRLADEETSSIEVISPRDYLKDEVAEALTLTPASADDLIRFATELNERLPGSFAALATGDLDFVKARTMWHGTEGVSDEVAAAIEVEVLPRASRQTTGEIRAKIRRLVKRLDSHALSRRRASAEKRRAVMLIETDDGTAYLTGADLPADAAGAAYGRVAAIAAGLKRDGDDRGMDELRADVFLALLRGTLTAGHAPAEPVTRPTGGPAVRPDANWSDADDAVADVIADAARDRLTAFTSRLPDRHCGLGVLIAQAGARITASLADLRYPWCLPDHDRPRHGELASGGHGSDDLGYRLPAAMRRLIEHRDRRCCFPGCRRPVRHCDADHSIPFQQGGVTCPCNIAMLCRRHHRLKQTRGWRIEHIWPGVLLWIGPTGHWRITAPADRE